MTQNDPALERARTHVKGVRDFFYHLMTYVFVGTLVVILDLRADTSAQPVLGLDWAYWVILFWGLGVAGHAISVFVGNQRVQKIYADEQSRELTSR